MKWIVFLAALFVFTPWLASRAAASPALRRWIVGLMGFSVFHSVDINLIAEQYRGESNGIEVTLLDLMALALFIAHRMRGAPRPPATRFAWTRALYMGVVVLSMTASPSLSLSMFSAWKLVRMFFVFSVLLVEFAELAQVRAALLGLGIGVLTEAGLVLDQRYLKGLVRVYGSLPHPNSLAMLVNLVTPVSLSLLLAGHARRLNGAIVAAGALCVIMSLSRGGILMLAVSTAVVVVGSLAKEIKLKKLAAVGTLMAGGVILLLKSLDTIMDRFTNAPKGSEEARVLFNLAARAMADEHSRGVGINMFSRVLDAGGYADRFELPPIDRDGVAHHIYWLTAAELGYVGLAVYILLLAVILVTAARCALAKGIRGEIALGITAGLTVMYIQGTAEWIARQTQMSYAFWMLVAIVGSQNVWARAGATAAKVGVLSRARAEAERQPIQQA